MVSFSDLKDAEPDKFSDAATAYSDLSDQISERLSKIHRQGSAIGDAYEGEGGAAAVDAINVERDDLSSAQSSLTMISAALDTLGSAVSNAQDDLDAAIETAAEIPATVSDDGVVKIDWGSIDTKGMAGSDLSLLRQAKQGEVDAVQQDIDDAVEKATEADETAESEISGIEVGAAGGGGQKPSQMPQEGWSTDQVNDWWEGLSAAERQWMLANKTEMIGTLDGVPSVYRDIANRTVLNEEIAVLENKGELSGDEQDSLEGMYAIQERLDAGGGHGNDERAYLLMIDPNEDGQAIVAIGNPDTADNVFTYVPGIQNTLGGIGDHMGRVDQMVYDANQVEGGGSTAGIVWFGYDAPPSGMTEAEAVNAGSDLDSFQDGLRSTHVGPPSTNTMIGHSYGSTVIGVTDRDHSLDVDQMAFVGSPGLGVDNASQLSVGGDNVYASMAQGDPLNGVGWHDADPSDNWDNPDTIPDEDFGGNTFTSDPGGHSSYWSDGNVARDNMALVVTGNGEDVTPMDPKFKAPPNEY